MMVLAKTELSVDVKVAGSKVASNVSAAAKAPSKI
jgi:hypothetical protein